MFFSFTVCDKNYLKKEEKVSFCAKGWEIKRMSESDEKSSQCLNQSCIPHLTITDNRCQQALDYYCNVFNGKIVEKKMADDNQRIIHSQLRLSNGTTLFVVDEFPEMANGKTVKLTENQYNSVTLNLSYINYDDAKAIWDKIKESEPAGFIYYIFLDFRIFRICYNLYIDFFPKYYNL